MAGAWATSWGLSWGGSWGAGAEPVVVTNKGGDGPRSAGRRKHRREQHRLRNEALERYRRDQSIPADAPQIKVTARAIKAAIALPEGSGWTPPAALAALPAYLPLPPRVTAAEVAASMAQAMAIALFLAQLRAEQDDEDDVEAALLLAA